MREWLTNRFLNFVDWVLGIDEEPAEEDGEGELEEELADLREQWRRQEEGRS